ncbi:MAG: hypothetical protein WEA31_00485 [Pirellulales bacterium]
MATVQDSQAKDATEARPKPAARFRIDPPHTSLPLLARIPDVSEVLAGAVAEWDEPDQSTEPLATVECDESECDEAECDEAAAERQLAKPPSREKRPPHSEQAGPCAETAPPKAPVPDDSVSDAPLQMINEVADPSATEPSPSRAVPSGPRFSRRQRDQDRSLVQKALSLPSHVPDGVFWSTVCGVLLLVAVIVWFNRDTTEARLPEGWENGQSITDSALHPPEVILPPTYSEPTHSTPSFQQHAPSVADQQPDPRTDGPTLADPSNATYPSDRQETGRDGEVNQTPPDTGRPGVARLQGIIEKPDLRATHDGTESRIY